MSTDADAGDATEADTTGPTITLYRLEGCPFCEFVVDRLDELDLDYDSVWVEGLHSRRNEVNRVSGQRQVPVIVDDATGVTMSQSSRILEYLDATYADEPVTVGPDPVTEAD
ncbi:NrdH-redoxin [Haloglomus irregulare]|jgi:glutathione S-transferase|uniref:NrdH-redoxin n=1 Tax=Haloglomus irregulare TaxID=2234134 RepID=A0A554NCT1_9EURY|nr:glutathione S-transferase N-terminal domain-containing protein [Haloglomus irregulare]TSD15199.1 NrdH-redoxin [Haloglomus irregulare]